MNETSIEQKLYSVIASIPVDCLQGDRAWTKAILKSIALLGEQLNYKVCSSYSDGDYDRGWLYDLIWYENDAEERLKNVPLVLESEWNRAYDKIKYDFEKLLIAKADHKLMVFQAAGEMKQNYFKNLEAAIFAFQWVEDKALYILICFDEEEWKFDIRTTRRTT